jgi:hypothetical protein
MIRAWTQTHVVDLMAAPATMRVEDVDAFVRAWMGMTKLTHMQLEYTDGEVSMEIGRLLAQQAVHACFQERLQQLKSLSMSPIRQSPLPEAGVDVFHTQCQPWVTVLRHANHVERLETFINVFLQSMTHHDTAWPLRHLVLSSSKEPRSGQLRAQMRKWCEDLRSRPTLLSALSLFVVQLKEPLDETVGLTILRGTRALKTLLISDSKKPRAPFFDSSWQVAVSVQPLTNISLRGYAYQRLPDFSKLNCSKTLLALHVTFSNIDDFSLRSMLHSCSNLEEFHVGYCNHIDGTFMQHWEITPCTPALTWFHAHACKQFNGDLALLRHLPLERLTIDDCEKADLRGASTLTCAHVRLDGCKGETVRLGSYAPGEKKT